MAKELELRNQRISKLECRIKELERANAESEHGNRLLLERIN